MKVDADKNPVDGQAFSGVRCIMNYPYGEEASASDYAVRMIDHAADRNVDIDDLVAGVLPDRIRVEVADADASPAKGAVVRFYPVRWYTYTVDRRAAGRGRDRPPRTLERFPLREFSNPSRSSACAIATAWSRRNTAA